MRVPLIAKTSQGALTSLILWLRLSLYGQLGIPDSMMNNAAVTDVADTGYRAEGSANPSGLACLAIIARHHRLDLTVPQLIHDNLLG
jgi:hypothetical protein